MTTVAGLDFDALSEEQVVARITADLADGRGGWVVTPNIDICRRAGKDPAARDLVRGASLIFTLSAAAAAGGWSVYLLGGEPGVPGPATT